MRERIQDQADEVVLRKDTATLTMLMKELDDSRRRAENCGCPTCKKHLEAIEMLVQRALDLVTPGQPIPNT